MLRRIGVLTGGGDCPGLNAAVRAVVKAAQSRHRLEVVGFLDGYAGVVEGRVRPLSADDVSGILASGGTILGTSNRADPFRYAEVRSDGSLQISDRSADALREIERRELDGLVVIGGDGSLTAAGVPPDLGELLYRTGCRRHPVWINDDCHGTSLRLGGRSSAMANTCAPSWLVRQCPPPPAMLGPPSPAKSMLNYTPSDAVMPLAMAVFRTCRRNADAIIARS